MRRCGQGTQRALWYAVAGARLPTLVRNLPSSDQGLPSLPIVQLQERLFAYRRPFFPMPSPSMIGAVVALVDRSFNGTAARDALLGPPLNHCCHDRLCTHWPGDSREGAVVSAWC